MLIENEINMNGEFLGISALAIYSAPWYLQIPLLALVVALFLSKVSRHSKEILELSEAAESKQRGDFDHFLSGVNRAFFGFAVHGANLTAYWTGFAIYLVTVGYAIYNVYSHLGG